VKSIVAEVVRTARILLTPAEITEIVIVDDTKELSSRDFSWPGRTWITVRRTPASTKTTEVKHGIRLWGVLG
jgi:hypothetical protein